MCDMGWAKGQNTIFLQSASFNYGLSLHEKQVKFQKDYDNRAITLVFKNCLTCFLFREIVHKIMERFSFIADVSEKRATKKIMDSNKTD